MSISKNQTPREELDRIEDALVDSILRSSGDELHDELVAAGFDPESCIAEVEATIIVAMAEVAHERLTKARREHEEWNKRNSIANPTALDAARVTFERLRAGNQTVKHKMMLAARKGEGLSDRDIDALLNDIAALEDLERGQEDE